jgi:hypothetical protein
MIEELKPCPLCGATIERNDYGDDDWSYSHGDAPGECVLRGLHFGEENVASWNTRTAYDPDKRLSQEVDELKHDLERQMRIANIECNEAERLREALEEYATALHAFICFIDVDGLGQEFWTRAPEHEEAQHAMAANNEARAALSHNGG